MMKVKEEGVWKAELARRVKSEWLGKQGVRACHREDDSLQWTLYLTPSCVPTPHLHAGSSQLRLEIWA